MAELGTFSLRLAIFIAAYAVLLDLAGALRNERVLLQSARNATLACWLCLSTAIVALLIALVQCDFSINYVAEHTSRALPLAYRLSALWAGAAGSLLLWLWLQSGLTVLIFNKTANEEKCFVAYARMATNVVCCFFLVVLLFDKNVFAVSLMPPSDGAGLNPLLQHPAMVLHPPTLFIGYAAYVIPFAWAFAAMIGSGNQTRPPLFIQARNWMLIAWLFLTIGNALGSWWAYEELGWGGFWAWDPVENSSLMPWLTGTALLHCFKRYRPGSSIARWVIFLCLMSFSLCIFGTFLTRSGIIASVHAFPDPGMSILFLVLLGLVWFIVAVLAFTRMLSTDELKQSKTIKGDGITVLVGWVLIILVVVIFLGTLFPFLSKVYIRIAPFLPFFREHIPPESITLKPEYFTKISAPGGLLLLLLVGVCPHFFRYGLDRSWRTLGGIITAIGAVIVWLTTDTLSAPCFVICGYVALNIIVDFFSRRGLGRAESDKPSARRPLTWYGARLAHIGVVMMFIGIAGAEGYSREEQAALKPGQSIVAGSYTIEFDKITTEKGANFTMTAAEITVKNNGKTIKMKPAMSLYENQQRTSEVDIRRTLAGDLYVALTAVEHGGELINLRVLVKPMINWLWLGSIIMVIGASLVITGWYMKKIL